MVARRAGWVLLISLLAGGIALWAAAHGLGLNTDTAEMLSSELPFRKAWDRYERAFPQLDDTVIVVVESSAPEIADEAAGFMLAAMTLRNDLLDDVHRPDGGAFLRRNGLLRLEVGELEELAGGMSRAQPMIARLSRDPSLPGLLDLLNDGLAPEASERGLDLTPILDALDRAIQAELAGRPYTLSWQELLAGDPSGDGVHRRFIVAKPRLDYDQLFPAQHAIDSLRVLVREMEDGNAGVRIRLTGPAALAHDEMMTVSEGALRTTLLALLMVGVILWAALRSVRLIAATLITLVLGLVLTAGIAAVTVGRLNMISVAFTVLYVGLGVDYAIHVCLRYRELIERGHRPITALRGCIHSIGPALALCAVSTAIGFFSFTPTAFRGVSELGLIAGAGMFVSFAVTVTVLPALLAVFPLPHRHDAPSAPPEHRTRPLLDTLERSRIPLRWVAGIVAVGCIAVLPGVAFDYSPINLQDPDAESVAVLRSLGASDRLAPSTIEIVEPEAVTAHDRAVRLRRLALVRRVVTLDDYVATDQGRKLAIIGELGGRIGPVLDLYAPRPHSVEDSRAAVTRLDAALGVADRDRTLVSALIRSLDDADGPRRRTTLASLETRLLVTFPLAMARLRDALDAEPYTIDELPAELRARWISDDGLHRVQVIPIADVSDRKNLRAFVDEVRTVAPEATGEPVVLLEAGEAVIRAFIQAFVGALVAITVLLAILRSVREAMLVLFPLLLAGALTGAASVGLDIPFNFANIIALPLLLGIGVDSGIHIVQRMHGGEEPAEALLHTSTARAVLYSALTTILSFGSPRTAARRAWDSSSRSASSSRS